MIALVNTMSRWENHVGSILSLHRTAEAAEKANAKIQRTIRKGSGSNSYLPTTIVQLVKGRYVPGQMLHRSDVIA